MKYFQILINGQNFLVNVENSPELMGFYTTRFVEAIDSEDAENLAVQSIRDDFRIKEIEVLNKSDAEKNPMIYAEEIHEIDASNMETHHGFTWYAMEEA